MTPSYPYSDPLDEAFGEEATVQHVRNRAAAPEPPYLKGLNPARKIAAFTRKK
jgi:hypothetical protein